jgi:hypothetical protein
VVGHLITELFLRISILICQKMESGDSDILRVVGHLTTEVRVSDFSQICEVSILFSIVDVRVISGGKRPASDDTT